MVRRECPPPDARRRSDSRSESSRRKPGKAALDASHLRVAHFHGPESTSLSGGPESTSLSSGPQFHAPQLHAPQLHEPKALANRGTRRPTASALYARPVRPGERHAPRCWGAGTVLGRRRKHPLLGGRRMPRLRTTQRETIRAFIRSTNRSADERCEEHRGTAPQHDHGGHRTSQDLGVFDTPDPKAAGSTTSEFRQVSSADRLRRQPAVSFPNVRPTTARSPWIAVRCM